MKALINGNLSVGELSRLIDNIGADDDHTPNVKRALMEMWGFDFSMEETKLQKKLEKEFRIQYPVSTDFSSDSKVNLERLLSSSETMNSKLAKKKADALYQLKVEKYAYAVVAILAMIALAMNQPLVSLMVLVMIVIVLFVAISFMASKKVRSF
jgi:CHASE1-domain containing sensor protein